MNDGLTGSGIGETALGSSHDAMSSRRLRGLLWRENLAHGSMLWGYVSAWVIFQIVLLMFFHPGMVIAFGILCGLYFGSAFAGGDARDGALEFALGLPATRRELFLVRFLSSGGVLLFMVVSSVIAIEFEIAQKFWGLIVETGFTRPFEDVGGNWYAAAIVIPMATFCYAFGFACTATDRAAVGSAVTIALMIALIVGLVGMALEYYLFETQSGRLSVIALGATGAACAFLGYRSFLIREGVDRPSRGGERSHSGGGGIGSVVAVLIVVAIVMALLAAFFLTASRAPGPVN